MRAVNLLPRDHHQKAVSLPSTPILVGICAGVLVSGLRRILDALDLVYP